MEATVDTLQIEIGASSSQAAEQISKVTAALGKLQNKLNGNYRNPLKDFGEVKVDDKISDKVAKTTNAIKELRNSAKGSTKGLSNIAEGIAELSKSTEQFSTLNERLERFSSAMNGLKDMKGVNLPKTLPDRMRDIADAANGITADTIGKLERFTLALGNLAGVDLKGVGSAIKKATSSANEAIEPKRVKTALPSKEERVAQLVSAGNNLFKDSVLEEQFEGAKALAKGLGNEINAAKATVKAFANYVRTSNLAQPFRDVKEVVAESNKNLNAFKIAIKAAGQYVAGSKLGQAFVSVKKKVEELGQSIKSKITSGLKSVAGAVKGGFKSALLRPFTDLQKAVVGTATKLKGLGTSLMRIAMYRAIRTFIKDLSEAFREGTKNLYEYSRIMGTEFKKSMDSIATSALYIKNSFGAMAAPLLNAVAPVIDMLADKIANLANQVAQLIAAFTGRTVFSKATKYITEFGDATSGAAKAMKPFLAGFDEINRIDDGSGSGSGSSMDYSKMFEEAEVDSPLANFAKRVRDAIKEGEWDEAGRLLADKLNNILPSADKMNEWGGKLGTKISNGVRLAYSFLRETDFTGIGNKVSQFLNGALNKIDAQDIGRLIIRKITAGLDFAIGAIGGLDWKQLAEKFSDFFIGALDEAIEWIESKDWSELGANLFDDLYDTVSGIKFGDIASRFFRLLGAAIGAAIEAGGGFLGEAFTKVKEYFERKTEESGGNTWEGFKKGVKDAWSDVWGFLKENVVTPFLDGLAKQLGIEGDTPSEILKNIGIRALEGFLDGLKSVGKSILTWLDDFFDKFWSKFEGTGEVLYEGANKTPSVKVQAKQRKSISQYASGGFPDQGSLFLAGEAGPELVGTVNGRTGVANSEQLTAGFEDVMDNTNSVILQAAMNIVETIRSKDMSPIVRIGDKDIANAADRGNRLIGASLVR